MEQIELFAIESPCKGVCENSAKGFCKGCLRSRDERFHWFTLSNEERFHILELCKQRRVRLLKARQERLDAQSDKALPYGMEDEPAEDLLSGLN
ncbi:DUF1289 domain-containing protein [Marinomonas aquiplantarum]|uniref:Fe-S protein YdhL (DUF1289 family) n=1 Tax=Marinomonas aquiplantarum TaxID=491951 RepID=A0A366CVB6_9GAMM|nr:DUF1289 domain-containing protein [Marinomonas aquiplantarum]RBO80059.1 hypothetical protein DFP76_109112 [Marinomonas aquiplantarum]